MSRHAVLWHEILTSKLWGYTDAARIVFITMLLAADKDGIVRMGVSGIAHLARYSTQQCGVAISELSIPDADSRSKESEGRIIEKVPEGWRIVNFQKYQSPLMPKPVSPERREYKRLHMQKTRAKVREVEKKFQQEDLVLDGGEVIKPTDRLPTTPEARFVHRLFHRRDATAWNAREIATFKAAQKRGVFTEENQKLLAAFYAHEEAKGELGVHRRALLTFLNNIDGEIDKAAAFHRNLTLGKNGTSTHPKSSASSAANSGTSNAARAREY